MKNIRYLKFFILMCMWILLCSAIPVLAKESSEVEFAVKAVIPDNQTDQDRTYFDLMMKASQKQTIEVEIWNLTDQEIQIETQIHSAATNGNGVIEYGGRNVMPDENLPHQMEEIVTCDELVTVAPNDITLLKLNIQMPKEKYKGILAGGIIFKMAGDDEIEQIESTDGFAIQNTYSYVIGIVLRESKKELKPELVLNDVFYGEKEGNMIISANIQNIMAAYVNDLEVDARITRKGTKGTLYQTTKENMRMAPNSGLDFQIDLKGTSLNEGEFTLYINASTTEKGWNWEKDFTIGSDIAPAEEPHAYDEKNTVYLWLFAAVPILLLLSGIAVYRHRRMLKIKRNYKKAIIKEL